VPAHSWVPDAAQGASITAAAFLTTVPKLGAVVAVARLVDALPAAQPWWALVGVLAVASMTVGNLAAYPQTDVRRLLGWSTVSQVGYLLAAAAVVGRSEDGWSTVGLFAAAYAATKLGAFAFVASAVPPVPARARSSTGGRCGPRASPRPPPCSSVSRPARCSPSSPPDAAGAARSRQSPNGEWLGDGGCGLRLWQASPGDDARDDLLATGPPR
jgi:hypothetical protein